MSVIYPSPERIIAYNLFAISVLKAKKADKAAVLSKPKIEQIIEQCKQLFKCVSHNSSCEMIISQCVIMSVHHS